MTCIAGIEHDGKVIEPPVSRGRTLVVAASREQAQLARDRIERPAGYAKWLITNGPLASLEGFYPDSVFWCEGWERGRNADKAQAYVARLAAKRRAEQFGAVPDTN